MKTNVKKYSILKNYINFDDELYIRSKIGHYKNSANWLHKVITQLGTDRMSFILKSDDFCVIGFLIIKKSESKICSLFVDPSFRQFGYGKLLFNIAKNELKSISNIHFNKSKKSEIDFFIKNNANVLKIKEIENECFITFSF